MRKDSVFALLTVALCIASVGQGARCVVRDGRVSLELSRSEKSVFPCLGLVHTRLQRTLTHVREGVCRVTVGAAITSTYYRQSAIETGTTCRYSCGTTSLVCTSEVYFGLCSCKVGKPSLLTERYPVVHVHPHGLVPENDECHDKQVGYEFVGTVGCTPISADVRKTRVHIARKDYCRVENSLRTEVKYMQAPGSSTRCIYVCKRASPVCTALPKDDYCKCTARGIRKVLAPLSIESSQLLQQSTCTNDGCGECGECVKGECELRRDAWTSNRCPCGMMCPMRSAVRNRENRAGAILCVQNPALECAATRDGNQKGIEKADYCYESLKRDFLDRCGCAPGYRIVHTPESPESTCVRNV